MMRWFDRFPLLWLVLLAAWMAIAPITPEPHLIEKLRMLGQGTLTRALDIFDLALHAAPLLLLGACCLNPVGFHRVEATSAQGDRNKCVGLRVCEFFGY